MKVCEALGVSLSWEPSTGYEEISNRLEFNPCGVSTAAHYLRGVTRRALRHLVERVLLYARISVVLSVYTDSRRFFVLLLRSLLWEFASVLYSSLL